MMDTKVKEIPYTPYGLGVSGPNGKSTAGLSSVERQNYAEGARYLADPLATMGLPKMMENQFNRDALQLQKYNYLKMLRDLGMINSTVGASPGVADIYGKSVAMGEAQGLAGMTNQMKDEYLNATRQLLTGVASLSPKSSTKVNEPNKYLTMGGDLLGSAGKAWMGAGSGGGK